MKRKTAATVISVLSGLCAGTIAAYKLKKKLNAERKRFSREFEDSLQEGFEELDTMF